LPNAATSDAIVPIQQEARPVFVLIFIFIFVFISCPRRGPFGLSCPFRPFRCAEAEGTQKTEATEGTKMKMEMEMKMKTGRWGATL